MQPLVLTRGWAAGAQFSSVVDAGMRACAVAHRGPDPRNVKKRQIDVIVIDMCYDRMVQYVVNCELSYLELVMPKSFTHDSQI